MFVCVFVALHAVCMIGTRLAEVYLRHHAARPVHRDNMIKSHLQCFVSECEQEIGCVCLCLCVHLSVCVCVFEGELVSGQKHHLNTCFLLFPPQG